MALVAGQRSPYPLARQPDGAAGRGGNASDGPRIAASAHGLPLAIGLHVIGWGLSGVQVWLAAKVMGVPLSLFGALAIESAATSARVILFFVPGGLGMQEAGAVFAGMAMGVEPATALAFSLVLRLRDVCFGVALLFWPWLEYRRGSRGWARGRFRRSRSRGRRRRRFGRLGRRRIGQRIVEGGNRRGLAVLGFQRGDLGLAVLQIGLAQRHIGSTEEALSAFSSGSASTFGPAR
jgi:hypothetical protein